MLRKDSSREVLKFRNPGQLPAPEQWDCHARKRSGKDPRTLALGSLGMTGVPEQACAMGQLPAPEQWDCHACKRSGTDPRTRFALGMTGFPFGSLGMTGDCHAQPRSGVRASCFVLLLLTMFVSSPAYCADEFLEGENRDIFRDVASDLRCPTCTGVSVLESEAEFSVQIQEMVKTKLRDGKSKEEILDFFVSRYGPWILRVPSKSGINILAWILPVSLLILGPFVIWLLFWRRKSDVVLQRSRSDIVKQMKAELEALRKGVTE